MKAKKRLVKKEPQYSISNCTLSKGPFVFNADLGRTLEAVAKAAQANAEAIKSIADRVCGPNDYSTMIRVGPKS